MVNKAIDTEGNILEAARTVFTRRGFSGARMQEIADEAGINKALLHYYFRNKQQLFDAIFNEVFPRFIPQIISILNREDDLEIKIRDFVEHYIDEFADKPYIPVFMINEIHQNPERMKSMAAAVSGIKSSVFMDQLTEGAKAGRYKEVHPIHLMSNMLSLSIFPLIAKPIIAQVFQMDDKAYRHFLDEKKKIIPELIIDSITLKK